MQKALQIADERDRQQRKQLLASTYDQQMDDRARKLYADRVDEV